MGTKLKEFISILFSRKNIYGEQWTVGKCGKGPEERRGDMRRGEGHFSLAVSKGNFRWEKGGGRKDSYEAPLVPWVIEEVGY